VFSKWDLGVESYGLRRQAERDAALDSARHLGGHTKALSSLRFASAGCQRSPKAVVCFMRLLLFENTP
jgi:hypothetical protein